MLNLVGVNYCLPFSIWIVALPQWVHDLSQILCLEVFADFTFSILYWKECSQSNFYVVHQMTSTYAACAWFVWSMCLQLQAHSPHRTPAFAPLAHFQYQVCDFLNKETINTFRFARFGLAGHYFPIMRSKKYALFLLTDISRKHLVYEVLQYSFLI